MALTPTDRDEHFFKAMVDASDGSTPEELEPTERREHWYKEIIDAIKAGGGGSGGGGILVAHIGEGGALDKTWREIDAADVAFVVFSGSEGGEAWHSREFVAGTNSMDGDYFVTTVYDGGSADFLTSDPDDYPVRQP